MIFSPARQDVKASFDASLLAAATSDQDIVQEFFTRFFARHPGQRDSFNRPNTTQGAMVNEMIALLEAIAAQEIWADQTLESSVALHQSYGEICPHLFESALNILKDTMASVAGEKWHPEYELSWQQLIKQTQDKIEKIFGEGADRPH